LKQTKTSFLRELIRNIGGKRIYAKLDFLFDHFSSRLPDSFSIAAALSVPKYYSFFRFR
jgi:hypothetical protein